MGGFFELSMPTPAVLFSQKYFSALLAVMFLIATVGSEAVGSEFQSGSDIFLTQVLSPPPKLRFTDGSSPPTDAPSAPWLGNKLGADPVVLPGYGSISVAGTTVSLLKRDYIWEKGYFPTSVTSLGLAVASNMRLIAYRSGEAVELKPTTVTVQSSAPDHAVVLASGEPFPGLQVTAETRIEYDGTAMTTLRLDPTQPLSLERLDFVADIADTSSKTVIGFKADGIGKQKNRQDMLELPYAGSFVNVLGFADGDRSFWWFADDAKGWIWNGPTVTEVKRSGSMIQLVQHLIGDSTTLSSQQTLKFNFLVTPVADMGSAWRSQRVVAGVPTKEQADRGAKFKLWWTDAFAHDAFPYTELPAEVKDKVPTIDKEVYPGVAHNRSLVQNDRKNYGAEWIPYSSLHALSRLDTALNEHIADWELKPTLELQEVVLPYTYVAGKVLLTHNGAGYSDYLLWQLDQAIDAVDFAGIYFDHAPVRPSNDPSNGGWVDSNGKRQPALDILATRSFLKRLKTLFYRKGKEGYIFVHNSGREIIPAYTFAYAQYTGEQYRSGVVTNHEYLNAVPLEELRARLSPDQYGIRTVWLPVEWSYHNGDTSWSGSDVQRVTYRRYEALALLLDVTTHPIGAHVATRNALIDKLDEFGVNQSRFVGYWNANTGATVDDAGIKISAYWRDDIPATFYVATNVTESDVNANISVDASAFGKPAQALGLTVEEGVQGRESDADMLKFKVSVPAMDFRWFVVTAAP